ncbi:MAG: hypothetical protein HQ483_18400 [Rhodospirillales bacterium]|nr:hypothetical protein [Rhodospirillales bacterium]
MALLKDFKTPYGVQAAAYHMISSVRINRLAETVDVGFAVYRDADTRTAWKTARLSFVAASADVVAAHAARQEASGNAAIAAAEAAIVAANKTMATAGAAVEVNAPFPDTVSLTVDRADYAAVLNAGGGIDIAKTYTFTKTQADFDGASDA